MSISLVVALYAAWSSVFALGRMTIETTTPLFLTGTRMLFAGIVLLFSLGIARRLTLKLSRMQWLSIILLGVFSVYLTNALEFWGLQHLTAAKTCFIYSLSPFFAAFFSYLHFNEKMTGKKWIGLGIGALGFIPILLIKTGTEGLVGAFGIFSWPELSIMGAALCSVYGWTLLRLLVKKETISPLLANGLSMFIGGSMALIHSWASDSWTPFPIIAGKEITFIQGTLWMTLISNVICYNLYGYLLRRFTATFLSFMGLLSPIFASLSGWILLGEPPSWEILFSTLIVLGGLWMVYQEELKQGYIQKKKKLLA